MSTLSTGVSALYVKVFKSIFNGSLYGQFEPTIVFLALLVLAERDGIVDLTPEAIAAQCGYPLDIVLRGIAELEKPDLRSRTKEDEGRRIQRLEEDRDWGWRITNYEKYDQIRSAEERREYFRAKKAEQRAKSKNVQNVQDMSNESTLSTSSSSSSALTSEDRKEEKKLADARLNTTQQQKTKAKKPKVTLPDDFTLDQDLSSYAEGKLPQVDVKGLFESFCGKARAKSWAYADWRQAWQEFCRNCAPNSGHWAQGQYPKVGSTGVRWA